MAADIYPCVIVNDRYGGAYSGASWTAWNEYLECVPDVIEAGDGDCMAFWLTYGGMVGKGESPEEAYRDLKRLLTSRECAPWFGESA